MSDAPQHAHNHQNNTHDTSGSNNRPNQGWVQAATSLSLNLDNQTKKIAVMVVGGLSLGALLYKGYKALPSPHCSLPTAPGMHPVLGHVPFFKQNYDDMHDKLLSLIGEYEIVALAMPELHQVFLNTPQLCEWVFTTEFEKFFKGSSQNEKFRDLFGPYGEAIFVSDDQHWRFHRKIGSRMFSLRNLREYMFQCCMQTTRSTLRVLDKLRVQDVAIDINDILGRMTFDCFTSIAFGTAFDSMSLYPRKHPFGHSFDVLVELMPERTRDPFWKLRRAFNVGYEAEIKQHLKVVHEFTHNLVTEKKKSAEQNIKDETGERSFDLFSLYFEHDKQLSTEQMKYLALNFIIAGRDTTRMLTSWFLYDLCQFPEVKKKVVAEIDAFKAAHSDGLNYLSITREFQYLEAALCESLRYHPVVPFSVREARDDVVIPAHICKPPNGGNYVIKKGDRCFIHQFTVSRLQRFYDEPLTYDPMRFYEKGVRTFPQSVYPFFNQKPRLCLGRDFALMEAKIFLYHFLSTYSFEMVPNQHVTYTPGIILNMKNGLKISLTKRN